MAQETANQVPGEDILVIPSKRRERPYLVGTRCTSCNEVMLGQRAMCLRCGSSKVSPVKLSSKGRLHSFTVIMHPPPECEVPLPYGSGYVELPEGVLIPALLTETDVNALHIGMEMEMVIREVKKDAAEKGIVTYYFQPA